MLRDPWGGSLQRSSTATFIGGREPGAAGPIGGRPSLADRVPASDQQILIALRAAERALVALYTALAREE
ncbi:hypothetical protein [Sorangium sp. So ce426]|uniref:hypothetical protein n=1 Tax=Sorangium sp. So ce426 TaxID=3133312 RepID=UPI003F5C9084